MWGATAWAEVSWGEAVEAATPTFVTNSAAVALTTIGSPAYPATLAAGNVILLFAATGDGTSLASSAAITAGFAALGVSTGGGESVAAWWKVSTGSETGSIDVTTTGGTKGVAWMENWAPAAGLSLAVDAATSVGIDTDATTTSFSCTGTSFTSQVNDVIKACSMANGGTYTGTLSSWNVAQSGATLTATTGRFGARTGTNTLVYNSTDATVTTGGTGSPAFTATATGANAQGQTYLIVLRQSSSTAASASGSLTLGGTAGAAGSVSGTGALTLGGTATGQAPATASGAVTLGGTAAWTAPPAAGSLTLGGSAAWVAPPAAGALTLGGTAAGSALPTAAGSLTLGGTSAWTSPPSAGALTLGGSAVAAAPVTATGALTLGGTAVGPGTAAAGSVTLGGTATGAAPATAAGAVTLGGTAAWVVPSVAGSIVLGGTSAWRIPSVPGAITLGGSAASSVTPFTGSITLAGTGTAAAPGAASGAIALGGSGTGQAPIVTTGSIVLDATSTARGAATVAGSIVLDGTSSGLGPGATSGAGSITLDGSALAQALQMLMLVYTGTFTDAKRGDSWNYPQPNRRGLGTHIRPVPTQKGLLLYKSGKVVEVTSLYGHLVPQDYDEYIAGGHPWTGMSDTWEAAVLQANGYTLVPV